MNEFYQYAEKTIALWDGLNDDEKPRFKELLQKYLEEFKSDEARKEFLTLTKVVATDKMKTSGDEERNQSLQRLIDEVDELAKTI